MNQTLLENNVIQYTCGWDDFKATTGAHVHQAY